MTGLQSADQMRPEVWTASANLAVKLSLVDDKGAVKFSPTWTYPIYGDSEQIFGYQDLHIDLAFDSVTFKPFLKIKYSKKLNDPVEDVQQKLLDFLPKGDVVLEDEMKWVDNFQGEQQSFKLPAGEQMIFKYNIGEDEFAVYKCKLSDEVIRRLHRRVQIFTLFFIESASYIDEDDDAWDVFIIFNQNTKQCIGYTSTYKYWKYLGAKIFDVSTNYQYSTKISQFIIFPPYQGNGHGSFLYNALIDHWQMDSKIIEITVEDPNESFDALRDKNDLLRLHSSGFFNEIPQELPLSDTWIHSTRRQFKLEQRQFMRLVEMILLQNRSPNFRLQVKKRLYEKNYDILADLDLPTRNDKLQTAFLSIKDEYETILSCIPFKKRASSEDSQSNQVEKKLKI